MTQNVEGVDYGEITENQEQDYLLNSNQEALITDPKPTTRPVHAGPCGTPPGDFSVFPEDVMLLILGGLDSLKDVTSFGCCSVVASNYSCHENVFAGRITVHEEGKLHLFNSGRSKENYERIQGLLSEIVKVILPEHKRKHEAEDEGEDRPEKKRCSASQ
eukprot:TRINITY_DN6237_c0_g2_i2.p1 TRINITY_DN6237_c0_g2~~TRINITY_DN6237_c0_g2_i2.p1  ORF type:complete len:160 (-),score=36.21 TRINITY_DN6237_c0_g2_i2:35-514(-)